MSAVDQLRDVFHAIAGLLVWPVLGGLLALAAIVLLALGAAAREAWDRGCSRFRSRDHDARALDGITATPDHDTFALALEETLQSCERRRWRQIHRLRLAVRVGPSLGLMGTLIPMADALQGLAEGNLPALASNMVTAFAATVIGLTISVVAYLLSAVREEWSRVDGDLLRIHAERRMQGQGAPPTPQGQ